AEIRDTSKLRISALTASLSARLDRVLLMMREHPEEAYTTQSLADVAALSPYHFNRVFRRAIGIPPAQYLCALRIEAATRLLLTTPLRVTDVCFDVGYNSLGTFVTRFTQLVGLSPNALRRAVQNFRLEHVRQACDLMQRPGSQDPGAIPVRVHAPLEFDGVI